MMRKFLVAAVSGMLSTTAICDPVLQTDTVAPFPARHGGAAALFDELPADVETHTLSRTNTVWFGKWKSRIEGYADVVRKEGVITSDHETLRDHEENRVEFKVNLELAGDDHSTASAKGQFKKLMSYQDDSTFFDELLAAAANIEGGTTSNWQSQTSFTATIVTSFNPQAQWNLHFETATGSGHPPGRGSLSNGARTVLIMQADDSGVNGKSYMASRFDFVENGRSLGAMGIDEYRFRPGLEAETKLLLATAMEAVWVASFRPHDY